MTLSSSLNAGVAGLTANATRLAAISDNIANSGTIGYRRVQSDFHSMVTSSSGGGYSAGGVMATTQRLITEQGPLIPTSNSTDLAVGGGGFFPVSSMTEVYGGATTPQMMLASTGSFRPNADGYLVSPAGHVLMGWPANADGTIPNYSRDSNTDLKPVQLDFNKMSGSPTTLITLGANLPATSAVAGAPGDPEFLSVEYFGNLGSSESLDIEFTPTGVNDNEWTMSISDSASAVNPIAEFTLTFLDDRTDGGSLESVTFLSSPTTPPATYDPLTGKIMMEVDGGPMELDIGMPGAGSSLTQLSDTFAPQQITKDGAAVGSMVGVEVDANGFVHAYYDNGTSRKIYQVPLVDMPNPNGMIAMDGQVYMPSNESGSFFLWDAGTGPTGELVGYALQESATDVATELTDLIQTQRAYSSSAKVIQTVDEMLQETTNIKR